MRDSNEKGKSKQERTSSKPGARQGRARGGSLLAVIGPGLLVAATGVGAGDLATASLAGSQLGLQVLWAVVVGAALKYALNEGLARFQLETGKPLLVGAIALGRWVGWLFLPYLLFWTFCVAAALMSACGVTLYALMPIFPEPHQGKVVFGIAQSLLGVVLVWLGGFRLFERVMGLSIGVMFVVVTVTAVLLWPETGEVMKGLVVPTIPQEKSGGLAWTVALLGGVGGTVTLLCYGYWIAEEGRTGTEALHLCRIDLAVAYVMTALFGLAMVIIGSTVEVDGRGARLLIVLSERLEGPLGPIGRWSFLVGAWGAMFSSLLGVWQAVPYLYVELLRLLTSRPAPKASNARATGALYHRVLVLLGVVPMLGLFVSFKEIQKVYAVLGAAFIPLLAGTLLSLDQKKDVHFRSGWLGRLVLSFALLLFGWFFWLKVREIF